MPALSEVQAPVPKDLVAPERVPLLLIQKLCKALADEQVAYCHWKSNNALDRCASGDNDLDLLVARVDIPRFLQIVYRLGFKEARPAPEKQIPGIVDFYGYDEGSGKLIHIHAHYQLVLGQDLSKNFRLPIEAAYLRSAVQGDSFRVPAPEFELIVLVLRLVLKHLGLDAILSRTGRVKAAEQAEMDYLRARVCQERLNEILAQDLPYIDVDLFNKCLACLRPGSSLALRLNTGRQVQAALRPYARHPYLADALQTLIRRWSLATKRRLFRVSAKHRLIHGGFMVAIVGGDGAGKTTLIRELNAWLSEEFDTWTVHLGKPPESWTTIAVRAILRLGTLLGLYPHLNNLNLIEARPVKYAGQTPWMLRETLKARDRYSAYLQARRFVNRGGIVFCDRFPLPELKFMDGPVVEQIAAGGANRISDWLIHLERPYYQMIRRPELILVLRLDPEDAVRRRTGEDPNQVRARSAEIWNINWDANKVNVIDAHMPLHQVTCTAKSLIWAAL